MSTEAAQRLTTYCREQAGESFRSVVTYDETGYELTYLRDDLQSRYDENQFDWLVDRVRTVHNEVYRVGTQEGPLGEARATVHYFEGAFVIQLVPEADRGYFATFDSHVGQTLGGFINDCLQRVQSTERGE